MWRCGIPVARNLLFMFGETENVTGWESLHVSIDGLLSFRPTMHEMLSERNAINFWRNLRMMY